MILISSGLIHDTLIMRSYKRASSILWPFCIFYLHNLYRMGRPNERVMLLMLLARALLGDDKVTEAEEKCQE